MGIHASCDIGTGRAHCKICKKLIAEEQIQIFISGWKTNGAIHSNPVDCLTDLRLNGRPVEKKREPKTRINWIGGTNENN